MWFILSILAAFFWGIGGVITKKGLYHISPLYNNVLGAIVTLILIVPFALSHNPDLLSSIKIIPHTLLVGALLLCYYYVLEKGQISLTGTVLATYPLITVVLSFLFLNEQTTFLQNIAILIIILGSVVLVGGENKNKLNKSITDNWIIWALGGAFAIGISDFIAKTAINQSDIYSYLVYYSFAFALTSLVAIIFDKKGRSLQSFSSKNFLPTFIGVTMTEVGMLFYYLAISKGLLSIVTPISSSYTVITIILSWIFLKDKINKIQWFGITLSVLGIILIGVN